MYAHLNRNQQHNEMKKFNLTLVLLAAITAFASAQTIGFNMSRGISTICPDYSNFKSSLNYAVGLGVFKTRPINSTLSVKSGINFTSIRSCLSVTDNAGEAIFIPEKYNYVSLPILLEKQFFGYSRTTRRASHYTFEGGVLLSQLFHEKGYAQRVGNDFKTRAFNVGAQAALQMVKPVKWETSFAIGPEVKAYTTGQEHTSAAFYVGIRADWKFGKY